jgi:hypothetical protein
MSALPNPADLTAIADRIAAHAAATRERALRLDHAVAATGWSGAAAAVFDAEAHVAGAALHGAAGRLDDAADALRRHAARVNALLDDLADLARSGLDLVGDAVFHPDEVLPDAVKLVGGGIDLAGDVLDMIRL